MANNKINKYIGIIAFGTALTAVTGCTDTWDDHYNSDVSVSGTSKTLWNYIEDNWDKYSRFGTIAQNAKYYKDDTHPVPTYTYADVLNSGQVNTVWIPDNSVLTEAEYEKWLAMSQSERPEDGYNVQQQFLGNHIALFRHNISGNAIDTVKMINGKNLVFIQNADKTGSLQGIALGDSVNKALLNGVIHDLKGIAPFRYNLYEQLKYTEPRTKFGNYVVSKDTTYFSADMSIEGLPDEDGNPTYVDSVYHTSNRLFSRNTYLPAEGIESWQMEEKCFGAQINSEDSSFIMLMPTDQAWDAMYEKLKDSYKYAARYSDKAKGDIGSSVTISGLDPDSLQRMSINMDIIAPLVFNINKQPKKSDNTMWKMEDFVNTKGEGVSYLLNTYGDTLRNIGDWKTTDLFDAEPVQMSNGYAYMVNSLNFPDEYLMPDVEVEIENFGVFYNTEGNGTYHRIGSDSKRYAFNNTSFKDFTDLYGTVSNNNFFYLTGQTANAGPRVEIKLKGNSPTAYVPGADVMSGKYDIQVVLVPYWYMTLTENGTVLSDFYKKDTITVEQNPDLGPNDTIFTYKQEIDTEYVKSYASQFQYKFNASLTFNSDGSEKSRQSLARNIVYDGQKVDTITVAEDFEFPTSYKNMRFSYPVLTLEGATISSGELNPKDPNDPRFVRDIVIDKIILKRKK
ncbi:MAG: hypothetical protein J1F27_07500 [Prevotellaceae bacterium]|nr:hypothetical protein [Prevotellaceae bacterium]